MNDPREIDPDEEYPWFKLKPTVMWALVLIFFTVMAVETYKLDAAYAFPGSLIFCAYAIANIVWELFKKK